DFRLGLLQWVAPEAMRTFPDATPAKSSSVALARLALFSFSPELRTAATLALVHRPAEDFAETLLEGLRHPWVPAAVPAAESLVRLGRVDLLPEMVAMLDQPEPAAPFEAVVDNKKVVQVREMVRVNHHRNCLLCHAPASSETDPVAAA